MVRWLQMCSAAPKWFAALAGSFHNATLLGGKKSFDDRDRGTVKEIKHVGMFHRRNSRGLAWPPSPTTLATGSAIPPGWIRWWKLPPFTMVRWLQMCSAAPKWFAALAGSFHNATLLGGKKSFDDRDRGTVKEIKHIHTSIRYTFACIRGSRNLSFSSINWPLHHTDYNYSRCDGKERELHLAGAETGYSCWLGEGLHAAL